MKGLSVARKSFLLRAFMSAAIATAALAVTVDAQSAGRHAGSGERGEKIITAAAAAYHLDRADLEVTSRTAAALPLTGI